jgi:hypothetical protein
MSLKTDFDESFFEDLLKLLLALQRHRGGVGGGGGGGGLRRCWFARLSGGIEI